MNLTVRIHDKEYIKEVAQGVTFTEEYNETLDSGVVRLSHIRGQIEGLKPYDDVYIYESAPEGEDETKWFDSHIVLWRRGGIAHDGDEIDGETGIRVPFYRHLLIDNFTEDIINLSEDIYSYTLSLFSETKGLETVQLPNISVTQPLNISKKVDIYKYLIRFVNLYSPKYKKYKIIHDSNINKDINSWEYVPKYTVAPELKSIFGGFYSQNFTLSNPNLRDVLSSLMITLDMIPYVKDNVIYAKAISERTGEYRIDEEQQSGRISRIVGQMNSSDFCDGVRRQYSDALSQDGTCSFIEYLGFRNKNEALLTLDNMQLETTHDIYKVKKMNMCFYQSSELIDLDAAITSPVYTLSKYDITPLVKEETEWNLLSQDWRDLQDFAPISLQDLSNFKISTISYSIGSNIIKGWGSRIDKIKPGQDGLSVYNITETYIENILKKVCAGYAVNEITSFDQIQDLISLPNITNKIASNYLVVDTFDPGPTGWGYVFERLYPFENMPNVQRVKTIFFEIEYEGFYNGAIIHSKDIGRDNIISNDNASASLTLLEKDGLSQKEKLNRFGNKTYIMNGRLSGVNYSVQKLLQLGSTGIIGADDDVIIYRRQYSIFNNYISVSYAGIKDYVLKNFYTNVYAKYRTYQLMSYGESIKRAETKRVFVLLSKDKKYKNEKTFFEMKGNKYNYDIIKASTLLSNDAQYWDSKKNTFSEDSIANIADAYALTIGKKYFLPIVIKNGENEETGKYIVIVSEIIDNDNIKVYFIDWVNDSEANKITEISCDILFSAFLPSTKLRNINNATIKSDKIQYPYFVDEQTFTSGNILCFNVAMQDNISGGGYIDKWATDWEILSTHPSENPDYYIGSKQKWYNIVDDDETGAIENLDYELSHTEIILPNLVEKNSSGIDRLNDFYTYCKNLPIKTKTLSGEKQTLVIKSEQNNLNKDNKETIDMTFQVEPIAMNNDIIIGQYFSKLSDLILTNNNAKVDISETNMPPIDGYNAKFESTSYGVDVPFYFDTALGASSRTSYCIKMTTNNTIPFISDLLSGEGGEVNAKPFALGFTVVAGNVDVKIRLSFSAAKIYWDWSDVGGITKKCLFIKGRGEQAKWTKNSESWDAEALNILNFIPSPRDASGITMDYFYRTTKLYEGNTTIKPEETVVGRAYKFFNENLHVKRNMFIEFSTEKLKKEKASTILPEDYNKSGTKFSDKTPSDIFSIIDDRDINNGAGESEKILRVSLSNVPEKTKSIGYWYFDFDTAYKRDYTRSGSYYEYTPQKSGYRLVFGVNITDADIARGYVNIYISKVTNRDERVYDSVGRQVGIVHNCVDENGNYVAPTYQTFDPKKTSPNMVNFKIDNFHDNTWGTREVTCYAGEQVLLQCESELFESWVIGEKNIEKNPYRLLVESGQKDVQLKISVLDPTEYSAIRTRELTHQNVYLNAYNPNDFDVSVVGKIMSSRGEEQAKIEEKMQANSRKEFVIHIAMYKDIVNGWVEFHFEANKVSVSSSIRVPITYSPPDTES